MPGSYQKKPSRSQKGCIIFLLDHSLSMSEGLAGTERPKREALATAINRLFTELILKCEKGEAEPRDYFDVGVIAYTTDKQGTPVIGPALKGALEGRDLISIPELNANSLRIDLKTRKKRRYDDDGTGQMVEIEYDETIELPVWYDAPQDDEMAGTPMCAALEYVHQLAADWCVAHPDSFPPIVIHLTDGESNDGVPEAQAQALRSLETTDGNLLLFNCHLSGSPADGVLFPASEGQLPDERDDQGKFARMLFRMSSPLPDNLFAAAQEMMQRIDERLPEGARGMAFNADAAKMLMLINVGTVIANNLR